MLCFFRILRIQVGEELTREEFGQRREKEVKTAEERKRTEQESEKEMMFICVSLLVCFNINVQPVILIIQHNVTIMRPMSGLIIVEFSWQFPVFLLLCSTLKTCVLLLGSSVVFVLQVAINWRCSVTVLHDICQILGVIVILIGVLKFYKMLMVCWLCF